MCKLNPNRENTIRKSANTRRGRKLTASQRIKLSIAIKKSHAEGRAIGWHWRKNRQTKAEAFFEKIANDRFQDKKFKTEHRAGPYAIDFAWLHKFVAVEIDGCQHEKPCCKMHDQKRDDCDQKDGKYYGSNGPICAKTRSIGSKLQKTLLTTQLTDQKK